MSALDEAREVLGHMDGIVGEPEQIMALAQIHATLAIAEQLQLANLIAITTNEQTSGVRYTADILALADPTWEDQS